MPAGSDSDRSGVRFERGLYVGLAAAAAAVGMTVAAYLTARQAIKNLDLDPPDILSRYSHLRKNAIDSSKVPDGENPDDLFDTWESLNTGQVGRRLEMERRARQERGRNKGDLTPTPPTKPHIVL